MGKNGVFWAQCLKGLFLGDQIKNILSIRMNQARMLINLPLVSGIIRRADLIFGYAPC
jgi:hypothetical protein